MTFDDELVTGHQYRGRTNIMIDVDDKALVDFTKRLIQIPSPSGEEASMARAVVIGVRRSSTVATFLERLEGSLKQSSLPPLAS